MRLFDKNKYNTSRTKIEKILNDIHDPHFSGEFIIADATKLREALASKIPVISYYDFLKITDDAQAAENARRKYLLLARQYHPDKNMEKSDVNERAEIFKLIQEAYETLSDSQKKLAYDTSRQMPKEKFSASDGSSQHIPAETFFFRENVYRHNLRTSKIYMGSEFGDSIREAKKGNWHDVIAWIADKNTSALHRGPQLIGILLGIATHQDNMNAIQFLKQYPYDPANVMSGELAAARAQTEGFKCAIQ